MSAIAYEFIWNYVLTSQFSAKKHIYYTTQVWCTACNYTDQHSCIVQGTTTLKRPRSDSLTSLLTPLKYLPLFFFPETYLFTTVPHSVTFSPLPSSFRYFLPLPSSFRHFLSPPFLIFFHSIPSHPHHI